MHKYIKIHPFFIPSTHLCDTGGTGWCRGRLDMGKGNSNEIPVLNHWQVTTSACISMLMHTPTPTNWAQKVLFGTPYPQDIAVCFLSRFQIFLFKGWVWNPELTLENAFGKEDKNRSEGSSQPPLTSWLGCWSPNQHWGPCWPQQSKDIKTYLRKGPTVCSLTQLLRWLVFKDILVRGWQTLTDACS